MKTELLQMRISQEIKAIAKANADILGLSVSEYIRLLILKDK